MKFFHPFPALFLGVSFLLASLISGHAANFSVTTTASDGVGSLRQAFIDAGNLEGADTIFFDETIAGQTITLTESIFVSGIVTLNGVSTSSGSVLSAGVTISGGGTTQLFEVVVGADLSLFNVTLTGGFSGGGAGAISTAGTIFLSACTLHGNSGGFGGAISGDIGASIILRNCTLTSNTASVSGGAIVSNGSLSLTHCTVVGNSAVSNGGGLFFNDQATVTQCILYGNTAVTGGDVHINTDGSMIRVGLNIIGSLAGLGAGSTSGPEALTDDPLLAPLGAYGGYTQTMPPLNGSPAIDPVGGATTSALGSDQRSSPRVLDATGSGTAIVDIGSVETGDFVVKGIFDSGRNSLRGIIQSAVTPGQVITFAPELNGSTIGFTSEIVLNKNVVLDARDLEDGITLSGSFSHRIFSVDSSHIVEMHRLRFIDGRGRGAVDDGSGGAIANRGTLLLNECTFSGNRANKDSSSNNRGGAVFSYFGTLTITGCTFENNTSTGAAGAVYSRGDLNTLETRLVQCTLTSNIATGRGGAIQNFGGRTELVQCTIVGNFAGTDLGGGVSSDSATDTETQCVNTIIAGNSSDVDLTSNGTVSFNSFTSQGHNLIGFGSGLAAFNQTGDQTETGDPLLFPLADNGGPTRTRLPMPESLALDAGGATDLTTDQRGFPRMVDGDGVGGAVVDIGAAESPLSDFSVGQIAFAETRLKYGEAEGTVFIPLIRTGGSFGEVTVRVDSTAVTASSGGDYVPVENEVVTFASGQTEASVPVTLNVDLEIIEPHETFTLALSQPTGDATLGENVTMIVVILDGVDMKAPTVAITSPKNNSEVPEEVVLSGTAKDDKGIARVVVEINDGGPMEAEVASSDFKNAVWSLQVSMVPGINMVTVYAEDDLGNFSKVVVSKLNYKVLDSLAVSLSGPEGAGTVSKGFVPQSDRLVGIPFKISAKPAKGFVFSGWSANSFEDTGVTEAAAELPNLTCIMQPDLELTANFIANPFTAEIAGSYNGLVMPEDETPAINSTVGFLTTSVTTKGSFSGKLKIDGGTYTVSGVFNAEGESRFGKTRTSTLLVKRKGKSDLEVTLKLDLEDALLTGVITQTLSGDIHAISNVTADRAHYSSKAKVDASLAGAKGQRYHLWTSNSFANPLPITKYPYGSSIGFLQVNTSGQVNYGGKLADDTPFTGSAPLSAANQFPLFVQLYKLLGSYSGNIAFDLDGNGSDFVCSDMSWYRPALPTSQYYPDGWPVGFPFFMGGEKYIIPNISDDDAEDVDGSDGDPRVLRFLAAADEDGNVSLSIVFEKGLLEPSFGKDVKFSLKNVITKADATDKTYTIKLNKTTGEVTGTFIHSDGKQAKFQAMIHQKFGTAGIYGYFMSPPTKPLDFAGESGYVSLFP